MSQPPFSGPPYNGQPSSGQPYPGQQPPYQGQQPPYQGGQQPPSYQQPYGQPNPDVPTSVPPSYPPTQSYPTSGAPEQGQQYGGTQYGSPPQNPYGQPDYAQQGYGQPGFPPAQPPAKKKSRTLPIVLTVVGIVLVLCVGGSIAAVLAFNNDDDPDTPVANPTTTSSAAPTTGETTEPAPAAETITISEPKTLGGRPKLTDAQFAGTAEELEKSLQAVPGATGSVGALYGTVEKQNIIILAAAEAPIANPERELDQTFYGAGVGGLKVTNITDAPTGALGGTAKCGKSESSGVDMVMCSWADDGSLGMLIWFNESVTKAKAEFPKLRAQVEKKG